MAEDRFEPRSLLHLDRVLREDAERLAVALVPDLVGKVLDEVTAAEDIEELEAAADRERRQIALERGLEQRELAGIAVGLRRVGRGMTVGAVAGRVDVDPAREDDPVEDVERLLDRLVARRDDERPPAGLLDRLDVVERDERRRQLPRTPLRGLGVGGDADDRAHGTDASGRPEPRGEAEAAHREARLRLSPSSAPLVVAPRSQSVT